MFVVAEGVETAEQLAFLQDNACPKGKVTISVSPYPPRSSCSFSCATGACPVLKKDAN
jgi:hypothetical protein